MEDMDAVEAPSSAAMSSNWKNLQKLLKEEATTSTSRSVAQNEEGDDGFIMVSRKKGKRKMNFEERKQNGAVVQDGIWKKRKTEIQEAVSSITVTGGGTKTPELTKALGLDCEYVGTGPDGMGNMLARVSVVNSDGECVYDKYVKPTERVTDFRTAVSGIRPANIVDGEPFKKVQQEVNKLLAGRIVVGHALQNDFKVLNFSHTRKLTRDTAKYLPLKTLVGKKFPPLKLLAKEVLGIDIQQGEHDSIIDARVAMKLYMMYKKQWENDIRRMGRNN